MKFCYVCLFVVFITDELIIMTMVGEITVDYQWRYHCCTVHTQQQYKRRHHLYTIIKIAT